MTAALLRASMAGAVGVALAWCVCRLVPKLSASTRAWIWWCVALKFVVALVWAAPIVLPVLPPTVTTIVVPLRSSIGHLWTTAPALTFVSPRSDADRVVFFRSLPANTRFAVNNGVSARRVLPIAVDAWLNRAYGELVTVGSSRAVRALVVSAWIGGLLVLMPLAVRAWRRARAITSASTQASAKTQALVADLSRRLSLKRVPDVRVSTETTSPFVFGMGRPIVVLPAGEAGGLTADAERMAICHELVHVKHADVPLGAVPALAELLFFFHPLAKYAAREYAVARETACDAAVLETIDASPADYGRLLVDFGVSLPRLGLSVAGASWSSTILKRRLATLGEPVAPSRTSRVMAGVAIALMLVMAVPMRLVARTAKPSTNPVVQALVQRQQIQSTLNAQLPKPAGGTLNAQFDFLLLRDDQRVTWGRLGSVSDWFVPERPESKSDRPAILSDELASARAQQSPGQALFWFEAGGQNYMVRDPETIRQIDAIWSAPAAPTVSADLLSHGRSLRQMGGQARTVEQRDVTQRLQALNAATMTLTALLRQDTAADQLENRTSTIGPMLTAIGTAMQQTARPGESDLLRILDRAWLKGLVEPER
jgi:beta-lactamase regulating signal transducer with metallopeptidase domain